MKKIFAIILMSTMLLSLAGCSLSTIEIGTKDGKVYFDYPNTTPKITVKRGEEKLPVEDPVFFEKLVNSIDGKPIPETVPFYPEYIYLVEIGKYDFALHEGHIIIYSPLGRNIKGQEIIEVECTKEEISELVELLDAAKQNDVLQIPIYRVDIFCGEFFCGKFSKVQHTILSNESRVFGKEKRKGQRIFAILL